MPTTLLLALLAALPAGFEQEVPADSADGPAVMRADLERHLRFLASDELEGREAGTEGSRRAAAYLAEAFAAAGLAPGGDGGTFLQSMPAVLVEHRSAPRLLLTTRQGEEEEGVFGVDFNVVFRGPARSTEKLPIVRVLDEADLPAQAQPDKALFFRSTPKQRTEWLNARGQGKGEGWGLDIELADAEEPGKPRTPPGRVAHFGEEPEDACEVVFVRGRMREALLWKGYESIQLLCDEVRTEVVESNVVALLPGTDPELSKEVVLIQAAYDHLGAATTGPRSKQEDRIRNGANAASAVAALLEIAQERAAAADNRRTLAFVLTTGTPKVLHGLGHFVEHPPFALERVVAAFPLDLLGVPDGANDGAGKVWMSGFERSNLGSAFGEAGLAISADPYDRSVKRRGRGLLLQGKGILVHGFFCQPSEWTDDLWEDEVEGIDFAHLETVTRSIDGAIALLARGELAPSPRKEARR